MKLTIFSTPKPFEGETETNQLNAIGSWKRLPSGPDIILFGCSQEWADKLGVHCSSRFRCSDMGTPIIGDMFDAAQNMAQSDVLMYTNSDMMYTGDLIRGIQAANARFSEFLMLGKRWDIEQRELIDFDSQKWETALQNKVRHEGQLHERTGMDYFVFVRPLHIEWRPLYVGRPGWDGFLVISALRAGLPVIDATKTVTAIHLNHAQFAPRAESSKESKHNLESVRGMPHGYTTSANYELTENSGLVKR